MPSLKAKLELEVGGMFSGKSSEIQRQGQRHKLAGHGVLYIKPAMDDRYAQDEIVTHDGQSVPAINMATNTELSYMQYIMVDFSNVILIDEVQFFDEAIIDFVKKLLEMDKVVYCAGLDMDFKGEPFKVTAQLMAMADKVNKFHAVCADCGADGYVTAKTSGSNNRYELGSKDLYKPVCRQCYSNYKEEN